MIAICSQFEAHHRDIRRRRAQARVILLRGTIFGIILGGPLAWGTPNGTILTVAGDLTDVRPYSIAVDLSGSIYIVEPTKFQIVKLLPGAERPLPFAGTDRPGKPWMDGLPATEVAIRPSEIALDPPGNLYFINGDSFVDRIDFTGIARSVAGKFSTQHRSGDLGLATEAGLYYPGGLVLDRDGGVYWYELDGNVRKVTPDGLIRSVPKSEYPDREDRWRNRYAFEFPEGILSLVRKNSDGSEFVVARSACAVSSPPCREFHVGKWSIDAAGAIYMSDGANHNLWKIAPDGTRIQIAGKGYRQAAADDVGFARHAISAYCHAISEQCSTFIWNWG